MGTRSGASVALATFVASASLGAFDDDDSGSPWIGTSPVKSARSSVANGAVKGDTASTSSHTATVRATAEQRNRVNDTNIIILVTQDAIQNQRHWGEADVSFTFIERLPPTVAPRHPSAVPAAAVWLQQCR